MPQEIRKNPVVNLSRGLVTEQNPLTPVENSTVDELNMDIALDGSRYSRAGLAYLHNRNENHPDLQTPSTTETIPDDGFWNTFVWNNPNNVEGISILVLQYVATVSSVDTTKVRLIPINDFFNQGNRAIAASISLTFSGASAQRLDFTTIKGSLIITGTDTFPVKVDLDFGSSGSAPFYTVSSNNVFSDVLERDFKVIGTNNPTKSRLTSDFTKYDTVNAGWNATALTAWQTGASSANQPPLNSRWYQDKDASGAFNYSLWNARQKGSTRIGAGSAIISVCQDLNNTGALTSREDWMNDEHPTLAPATANYFLNNDPDLETGRERLRYCATFAGRVWFGGHPHKTLHNRVFFSQVVEEDSQIFKCYQQYDPTSDNLSDLIDSDGGSIFIEDMSDCTGFKVFGDSLIVFGANGVWAIRGNLEGQGFSATSFRVDKISNEGVEYKESAVVAQNTLYYVNKFGVNIVTRTNGNTFSHQNISRPVIQKYWRDNYEPNIQDVRSVYDPLKLQIQWLFSSEQNSVRDKVLVLDLTNQAFLPWTFDTSLKVRDAFYYEANTVDGATSFEDYGGKEGPRTTELSKVIYVVYDGGVLPDDSRIHLAGGADSTQAMWNLADMSAPINVDLKTYTTGETDTPFTSYLETPPNYFGDMHNDKDSPEIITYSVKEKKFHFPFPVNYSSKKIETETRIKLSHSWDFEPFENEVDAYQSYSSNTILTTPTGVVGDEEYTFKNAIHNKKNQFHGRGKGLKLRFENDGIYPVKLLGYSVVSSRDRDFERN